MKTAASIELLLLISAFTINKCTGNKSILRTQSYESEDCTTDQNTIISDACTSFSTLDKLNLELRDSIVDITRNTDFFSYYRLNLFGKECPFWENNDGVCGNIACAVNTLDNEEQIPLVWRAEELGKLQGPTAVHPTQQVKENLGLNNSLDGKLGANVQDSCVVEDDDESDKRDYCIPEDESAGSRGDYVSLVDNPERFTGYVGQGAKQIWDTIYRENCFSRPSEPQAALGLTSNVRQRPAADELQSVLRKQAWQKMFVGDQKKTSINIPKNRPRFEHENECLEKRVFYRIISGMHTSISAHICAEYLNQKTGEWGPNIQCYQNRIHGFHDRVSNLYFNYAIVIRAIVKLGPYLKDYTFCSDDAMQNLITKMKVMSLIDTLSEAPQVFDEKMMFTTGDGPNLKEDFRKRFRNISRIMDCVGCDKCRLWGKLQTAGYGAALKILFESGNNLNGLPKLKRTEIVALFNTLARISSSVGVIKSFKDILEENNQKKSGEHGPRVPNHVVRTDSSGKENEFDEQERGELRRRRLPMNSTFSENLSAELEIIWKVTKYVIRSWINFPIKLWQILKFELPRVWNSYIGLPVKPRKWVFKRPTIDEL